MEYDFRRKATPVLIGLLLLLTSTLAFGQGIVTGAITGVVQDQQEAVVSGAKVTAKSNETNTEYTTESNSVGAYSLRGLPVATYTVTIEAPKFQKLRLTNVTVSSGRDSNLGAKTLTIGAEEVVNVESTPPQVETTTSAVTTSFSSKKVTDLPINSGMDQLALLVPGAAPVGDVSFGNTNGAGVSSNGQRSRSNNFQIDGQGNNDDSVTGPQTFLSNPDVIAEFQISTNYTAEYGRNLGSVINYVTKSGSNAFHGTLFEFHTNDYFHSLSNDEKSAHQSVGFCPPGVSTDGPDGIPNSGDECNAIVKPQFIENRFGGTFGGPILKDKAWFFGSYQGDRAATGNVVTSLGLLTPTPAGLATLQAAYPGNPAVAMLTDIGPAVITQGNPQFGNLTTIPVSDDFGVTTTDVQFGTVTRTIPQPFREYEITARGDIQITSKDRFFARYILENQANDNSVAVGQFAAGHWVNVPVRSQNIALDWTRTWSPTHISQARFSYGRLLVNFHGGSNPGCVNSAPEACPTNVTFLSGSDINIGLAANLPQGRGVNNSQWQYNGTIVTGRHTLKYGGEYARHRSPSPFLPLFNGRWLFFSFDDFLANDAFRYQVADGPFSFNYKEQDLAFYFQDDFRVKDNLTLNLGLRWEWYQQAINLLNRVSTERQTGSSPFWNTALPLEFTTNPKFPQDLNNWGPVFGFAWTPRFFRGLFGDDKTTIRGGYGIKYDPSFYNIFLNMSTSAPSVNLATFTAGSEPVPTIPLLPGYFGTEVRPATLVNLPSPPCPAPPPNNGTGLPVACDPRYRTQTVVDPDFHQPYSQQWSFGIQRQITSKVAFEARYVGNHGVGLFQTINANPALNRLISNGFDGSNPNRQDVIPDGFVPCPGVLLGPDGIAGTVDDNPGAGTGTTRGHINCNGRNQLSRKNSAFNIYHGLQTRLDIQNWHGVTANFGYTYSRNIDNATEIFSTVAGGQGLVGSQDPFDFSNGERAVSGISYPHVATLAFIYELPWHKNQQGWLGHFLGGWQFSSVYRYTGGQPWTPIQFRPALTSFCDPTGTVSGTFDTCRPILNNPSAPFATVGRCTNDTCTSVIDLSDGSVATSTSGFHWLINGNNFARFAGSPYLGVGRNTLRGETINNVNMSFFKTTKITERVSIQFQANAYNIFNRQFRGVPDVLVDDVDENLETFGNTFANPSGGFADNANESGVGIRRLIFGLKVIF